jgi:hypothetical protein
MIALVHQVIASLALMCALSHRGCMTSDAQQIAAAIDGATDDAGLRSHMVTYAWGESKFTIDPTPYSHDAKAHQSCGPWQEPCAFVETHSLAEQATYWLHNVQAAGLASVDSSPTRARHRAEWAARLLRVARPTEGLDAEHGACCRRRGLRFEQLRGALRR